MKLTHTQRCALIVLQDAANDGHGLTTLGIDRAVRARSGNTVSPNQATVTRLQKLGLIEWERACVWQLTPAGLNWLELNRRTQRSGRAQQTTGEQP